LVIQPRVAQQFSLLIIKLWIICTLFPCSNEWFFGSYQFDYTSTRDFLLHGYNLKLINQIFFSIFEVSSLPRPLQLNLLFLRPDRPIKFVIVFAHCTNHVFNQEKSADFTSYNWQGELFSFKSSIYITTL